MPRALVVGNGSVLATFDATCQMRDFYYPHVGMEDHTMYGHVHRIGAYVEGKGVKWFDDSSWEREVVYKAETLVTDATLTNRELGIELKVHYYVHPVYNILMRSYVIRSLVDHDLTVKLFFHHDLHIYGGKQKDTAFYEPYTNSVIHYRQNRYFLIGGTSSAPVECVAGTEAGKYDSILKTRKELKTCGITDYTVGKIGYKGLEGTWRDAEDGQLGKHSIEQGSVDSTVGISSIVKPGEDVSVDLWLCSGKNLDEVLELQQGIMHETPTRMQRNCYNYWKSWVNKGQLNFGDLSDEQIEQYKRSLLTVRLHCDHEGGMLAAADADIMQFNKDTYTYIWPRDGAFVSLALDKAGYHESTRRFFEFCERVQMGDGYLLHKYNPDGSVGSSWHPWYRDDEPQLPIQEDETALVLYAIWKHFEKNQDFEFLQRMYESCIKKAAQFLVDFREDETGLPLPSYDLWEEQRGVFTYTTACVVAGLNAAARICHVLGHFTHSERYQQAADETKQAMLFHLYDEKEGRFVKKIERKNGETIASDPTADISICTIWKLDVLPLDDPRVVSTMQSLRDLLTVQTDVGGIARYQRDYYHMVTEWTDEIPGNPWILTTLWLAQWDMRNASSIEDLQKTKAVFDWCLKYSSSGGMLAEQLNPLNGDQLSIAPLTWSHATYLETILVYLERLEDLQT